MLYYNLCYESLTQIRVPKEKDSNTDGWKPFPSTVYLVCTALFIPNIQVFSVLEHFSSHSQQQLLSSLIGYYNHRVCLFL